MPPDPTDPPRLRRRPSHDDNGGGWNWPGWLIAYIVTLLVLRDVLLTILQ